MNVFGTTICICLVVSGVCGDGPGSGADTASPGGKVTGGGITENGTERSINPDEDSGTTTEVTTGGEAHDPLCFPNPCLNGGECYSANGKAYCACSDDFVGKNCSFLDKCSGCWNGECKYDHETMTRYCHCDEGFYWNEDKEMCRKKISPCESNPCLNGGICHALNYTVYTCTCNLRFSGDRCEIRDMCLPHENCRLDGRCELSEDKKYRICHCREDRGFFLERRSQKCDVVTNSCQPNPCLNDGFCTHLSPYAYNCCTHGYAGSKCDIRDFCQVNDGDEYCTNGVCNNNLDLGVFYCSCREDEYFLYTENRCAELDRCPLMQCDTAEECLMGKCKCKDNYKRKSVTNKCEPEFCSSDACPVSGMICEEGTGDSDYNCSCPVGYALNGTHCNDISINGQLQPGICPLDEFESRTNNGFRCKCKGKFILSKDNSTCMVRNMCQYKEIGWKNCTDRKAECVKDWNTSEGFTCRCGWGQDFNEIGECQGVCSFEKNRNPCLLKGAKCDVDINGKMICKCPLYLKKLEDGGDCTKLADFSYMVKLPLDRSTYEIGYRKQRSLDAAFDYRKVLRDVTVTMRSMFTNFIQATIVSCKPATGSLLCKIELQFARDEKSDVKRLGIEDICVTSGNLTKCLLPPLLVLVKDRFKVDVDIQATDPCDVDVRDLVCGSDTTCSTSPYYSASSLDRRSFTCLCKPGFLAWKKIHMFDDRFDNSVIESCSDIDECVDGDPCPPNSICTNTIGNYTCSCKPGFRSMREYIGSSVRKCVEVCLSVSCNHGICSTRGDHDFECECDAGYTGRHCDIKDENFNHVIRNTAIVGLVLSIAFFVTLCLFKACVSRLRRRECLENAVPMCEIAATAPST